MRAGVVGFGEGATGPGDWFGAVCAAVYCCSFGLAAIAAGVSIGLGVFAGAGCSAGLTSSSVGGFCVPPFVSLGRFVFSVSIWVPLLPLAYIVCGNCPSVYTHVAGTLDI